LYDPEKGLASIAVAEIGEKHFKRAKDPSKLFKAIEAKITAQAEYVVWRDGVAAQQVEPKRKGKGGKISALKSYLPTADPGDVVAHRWRKRFCTKTKKGTAFDRAKVALALKDAQARCQRICEQVKDGTVRGTEGTGEFELYTPAEYIEAARLVLAAIDLDPASNDIAQKTVRAEHYFTSETNGLEREWNGRVWLNPPYHRDLLPDFVDKMIEEVTAGRVTAAIMLTNNCTDTEWFHKAQASCAAICFTKGRIRFTQPNGIEVLPTQGQAFFYFGPDVAGFASVFCKIGFGVVPSWSFDDGGDA
jgi:phage N-6-adenine-methyltransferase